MTVETSNPDKDRWEVIVDGMYSRDGSVRVVMFDDPTSVEAYW